MRGSRGISMGGAMANGGIAGNGKRPLGHGSGKMGKGGMAWGLVISKGHGSLPHPA